MDEVNAQVRYLKAMAAIRTSDARLGQNSFNVVNRVYPDIADTIRGTKLDPFYDDERLPEFWRFVGQVLDIMERGR